ncbi:hypothetical protein BCR43DRAFT_490532 [Syncephalastrum racemosum]|uniref:Nuclear cap-binding protein subunit 3 n=1 Tax=Syncephalastrum racemosum TaxID=13706 RepID=A0A1X2HG83_SYNRA|nr:hypothetical protein BCR43DRAFT_490532 [Syncephalastrum racemosum]
MADKMDLDIDMLDSTDLPDTIGDLDTTDFEQELADYAAAANTSENKDQTTVAEADTSDLRTSGPEDERHDRPEAILLHGVDDLSTKDIETYCQEHPPNKIEWINDQSCNLVYADEDQAKEAAQSLLLEPTELTSKILRKAKPISKEGDRVFDNLHIRVATLWDIKERGARERSRYYLLHGEEESMPRRRRERDIEDRLGHRDNGRRGEGDVFSRLGRRVERGRPYERHRKRDDRRSLSPQTREALPESLRNRLGSRRPPPE